MKALSFMSLVGAALLVSSCSQRNVCEELSRKSKDSEYVAKIEEWVNRKSRSSYFKSPNNQPTELLPGTYLVAPDVDLNALAGDAKVSIVIGQDNRPESIFFGKGSYRGLIVLLPGKRNTVVLNSNLKQISKQTYLVCIEKD